MVIRGTTVLLSGTSPNLGRVPYDPERTSTRSYWYEAEATRIMKKYKYYTIVVRETRFSKVRYE